MDQRGIQYGPAFTGLAAAHTAEAAGDTVLAEVALPGSIRSQQAPTACTRRCWMPASSRSRLTPVSQSAGSGGLLLPLGVRRLRAYGPARNARYCYTHGHRVPTAESRPTSTCWTSTGRSLLAVRGLQMGTGVSPSSERDRVLGERLLTIEWQQRELPEMAHAEPGAWLLISTSDATDMLATELTDALKMHDAQCTTMSWPQHADHSAKAKRLRDQLRAGAFTGVVVLTAPQNGNPDEDIAGPGR